MSAAGVSASNRAVLARLRRAFSGPFTVDDAADVADLDRERASRLLRHLAAQGWLTRVQRGLYAAVPIEAENPQAWRLDPWTIAATTLTPAYIGGWTALHHWDLTDQLFGTTVVITTRSVPQREREIGGARFELRHRPQRAIFGLRRVWREGVPVDVSDPERTLVDCLDDPSMAGGIRHLAEAIDEWARAPRANPGLLLEYADRLGNRTVFKRLGFVAESLDLDSQLVDACLGRISRGISLLDPDRAPSGRIATQWNLRVNASIEP